MGGNPNLPEVDGVEMYRSVGELPEAPDLVVAAVPGPVAPSVVGGCAGVGAVIVFGAGFAEAGPEGRALQSALVGEARRVGNRMHG